MRTFAYFNIDTEEYPIFLGDLIKLFPEIDIKNTLFEVPDPYVRVFNEYTPLEEVKISQKIQENKPIYDEVGKYWKRSFSAVDLTEEELEKKLEFAQEKIRKQRDLKLGKTDTMVVCDKWEKYDQATREKISKYRQELRDITEQTGFPYNVEWPVYE